MMNEQVTAIIISTIFSAGVVYGMINTKIKSIEQRLDDHKDANERFARIEEKVIF